MRPSVLPSMEAEINSRSFASTLFKWLLQKKNQPFFFSEDLEGCDHFFLEIFQVGLNEMQPCLHLCLYIK